MKTIFVFGSNLAGRHGAGAALFAKRFYHATVGVGVGLQGNAYAIPTKDYNLEPLPLESIAHYVQDFLDFADEHQDMEFLLTRVGCGLAGYTDDQIRPMFGTEFPANVIPPKEWA